jgi:membrane glycosyltransferase
MLALWVSGTAAFAWTLYGVMSVEAPTGLQWVFLFLSTLCFAWVAVGSASAVLGFLALAAGRGSGTKSRVSPSGPPATRTALLFPVYREEATAVAAAIDTMAWEIRAADAAQAFDFFILSDTQDEAERLAEQSLYWRLCSLCGGAPHVFVRWRTPNTGKKAGNIRDWIERFGGAYSHFVILDADSIMSAETLLHLVSAMEADSRAGIIQTVPRLAGAHTLFGRMQQFAAGYCGEVIAAGLAAWHGPGGNYWGHNAIIRTAAFASSAGLPWLTGRPPLGGHILSHDFVEAALLRRAGWEVHLLPSLRGSYEGCPPTLGDLVVRDRRWAQGNLQHLRLLHARGLPLLSRLHLAMGVASYLAAPIWALTLMVGVILALQAKFATPIYFGSEVSLFPKWPVFDAQKALALFVATVIAVHIPKLLGAAWALRNGLERKRNGGVARVVGGVLLESILSTLMAPVLMVGQTHAVVSVLLLRRDAGWGTQRRVAANAPLTSYLAQHRWHMAWGLAGAAVCWSISPAVLAWMSPIILGLVLAAPLARATAAHAEGWIADLLAAPVDRECPALLAHYAARRAAWSGKG